MIDFFVRQLVWDEMRHGTEEGKQEVDRLRDWITKKVRKAVQRWISFHINGPYGD